MSKKHSQVSPQSQQQQRVARLLAVPVSYILKSVCRYCIHAPCHETPSVLLVLNNDRLWRLLLVLHLTETSLGSSFFGGKENVPVEEHPEEGSPEEDSPGEGSLEAGICRC